MQLLYVIGTGVLAAFCVLLAVRICYQRRYIRTSDRINDCIFRNVAAYLLLIDPDFNVLQTNYRSATGTAPQAVPPKVGNLLRCRNGEDAGVCGTHELCADCPVRAAITHPVLSGPAYERINESALEEVIVTDTIPLNPNKDLHKFTVLSVADLFADVIERVHNYKEISSIFSK